MVKQVARDETTEQLSALEGGAGLRKVPALTILAHADVARVGERVRLVELEREPVRVSRLEPSFEAPSGGRPALSLDDPFVSRTPLLIQSTGEGLKLEAPAGAAAIVGGQTLEGTRRISAAELDEGITIELGPRVALLLHRLVPAATRPPAFGLIGDSDAIDSLRTAIARIADLPAPVLIRGETGTGKELVARALHVAGGREGALVAVNVAAIPASTAASALFGHVRGAFTGAVADLTGHFRDADRGTLFLDEVGEIPLDVQAALLRAVESGEILPVGGSRAQRVEVRLLAATDRDLEAASQAGTFRESLLHRLSGFQVQVPPLRTRRDDVGRLLIHFLREELESISRAALLGDHERRRPWLPAALIATLARQPWPGNVRQLRNVARQLAVIGRDRDQLTFDDALRSDLGLPAENANTPVPGAPGMPTTEQVLDALARHKYSVAAAAAELGVSRARMYTLAERAGAARNGRDVSREEIEDALRLVSGDLDAAAAKLRISPRALTLRITELGMERR